MNPNDAPVMSIHNRLAVENASKRCGCYFCLTTFDREDVVEYTDPKEDTALCPQCGIDTVLPNVSDIEMLKKCHERWFGAPIESEGGEI